MNIQIKQYIYRIAAAFIILPLFGACASLDEPEKSSVPEGMVEIRPVLPGTYSYIPRVASDNKAPETRVYDSNVDTNKKLTDWPRYRLPNRSTVWLIADNESEKDPTKRFSMSAYAVYNPEDDNNMSFLVPCTVNDDGDLVSMEGRPFYLKDNTKYKFSAISPARKFDEVMLKEGKLGFKLKNGQYLYANDARYEATTPEAITVTGNDTEDVHVINLKPMINQTALLKFRISKGEGVHDLDIQPSGIQISGLQNDTAKIKDPKDPDKLISDNDGVYWHMSKGKVDDGYDEPITLQHGNKSGSLHCYDYTIDYDKRINIEVPILPGRSISKPVIVVFRLKVNGVPSSYEMMLNEKDFKAGYSYGYRGEVSIKKGVTVITWQYVSWEYDVEFDIDTTK